MNKMNLVMQLEVPCKFILILWFPMVHMKKTIAIIENNILATNTIRGKLTQTLNDKGFNVIIFP